MSTDSSWCQLKCQQESLIQGMVKKETLFRANSSMALTANCENNTALGLPWARALFNGVAQLPSGSTLPWSGSDLLCSSEMSSCFGSSYNLQPSIESAFPRSQGELAYILKQKSPPMGPRIELFWLVRAGQLWLDGESFRPIRVQELLYKGWLRSRNTEQAGSLGMQKWAGEYRNYSKCSMLKRPLCRNS